MYHCFIMIWLKTIKKEYDQIFKSKDKEWRLKNNYKNLKDLDYQPDKVKPDRLQPDQLMLPKWVTVTKNKFD